MTGLIAERPLAFIDNNIGRYFFLEVAFNAPHFPFQIPGTPDDVRTRKTYSPLTGTRTDYIQMVRHLDLRINDILRSIDSHGLTAKTLVIFLSDNGGERLSSNAPFSGGKFTLWEGGIRVPCLLRWPGVISPGTVSHQAVITMDLAPLILAACGMSRQVTSRLDGMDVLPMITGKAPERERSFFWRLQGPLDLEPQKAMRRGRWKYLSEG